MVLDFRPTGTYLGVLKAKGLPALPARLTTLEMARFGSVPTSMVGEAGGMVAFLIWVASSISASVGTWRRYAITLWLWYGDRVLLGRIEEAVTLILGVIVTTGVLGADGTKYREEKWNEKGGGGRFTGNTDGRGGGGAWESSRDTRWKLVCARRRTRLHKGSWLSGGVINWQLGILHLSPSILKSSLKQLMFVQLTATLYYVVLLF